MNRLNYWIRNVFGFDQKQVSGFKGITILLLLVLALYFCYGYFLPQSTYNVASDTVKLDSIMAVLEKQPNVPPTNDRYSPAIPDKTVLFDFDPNQIEAGKWQALGLPKYIAERIIKYRQKGGKFKVKKDLLKIYGFPPPLYQQLYTHILLPDSITYENKFKKDRAFAERKEFVPFTKKEAFKPSSFNINTADTLQLKQIRGIGPALSKRIIKYRDLLGGFVNKAQIREVFGLDSLVVDELLKYGYLEENAPFRKLNVNTATAQELDAHPYISSKIANVIVSYRQQHGKYASIENLYGIRVIDKPTLIKLTPYLSFD